MCEEVNKNDLKIKKVFVGNAANLKKGFTCNAGLPHTNFEVRQGAN